MPLSVSIFMTNPDRQSTTLARRFTLEICTVAFGASILLIRPVHSYMFVGLFGVFRVNKVSGSYLKTIHLSIISYQVPYFCLSIYT